MRDMADELLRLYAERKLVGGYAFAADTPWQQEFEDGFPFVLTPDQETAIEDVKHDMEGAVPMDRLLCGDVGYGKTEVAMRAAFKSVMEGKQAAILTPTTCSRINTTTRFAIASLRFREGRVVVALSFVEEQKEVVKKVETGEVDVDHRHASHSLEGRSVQRSRSRSRRRRATLSASHTKNDSNI
jgi:transcription-repair coupling factor (superfamily II helicase)